MSARDESHAPAAPLPGNVVRALMERSTEAMTISHAADGLIVEVSESFLALTGYARDEVVGRTSLELGLIGIVDRSDMLRRVEGSTDAHRAVVDVRRRDGEVRAVEISAQVISGEGAFVLTLLRDITEERRREAQLERARRDAEDARERVERILAASPVPMAVTRLRDGACVAVNARMCELVGRTEDAVLGRTTMELGVWVRPGDRAALVARLAAEGRLDDVQTTIRGRDGEPVDVLVSSVALDVDGERCVFTAFHDVSARVRAEADAAAAQALVRGVLDSAPFQITVLDADLRIRLLNEAAARAAGGTVADVVGRRPWQLVPAERATWVRDRWTELAAGRRAMHAFEDVALADGTTRTDAVNRYPVRGADGRVAAWVVTALDMTEQRRAEAEVARLATENRMLLEAAGEGIVALDRDGCVTLVNPAAAEAIGRRPEDVAGRSFHDVVHARADHAAGDCPIVRACRAAPGDAPVRAARDTFATGEGAALPVEYVAAPLEPGGAVLVFRDVTERRRWEHDLEAARRQAEEASRHKSDFLATLSHEIRTPMNAVIAMAGLLQETALDGEQLDFVQTLEASAEALLGLLNDILDISKIEAGRLELSLSRFDLAELVEQAARTLAPAASEKALDLRVELAPDLPRTVEGDRERLRQVLVNLLGNAIKFTVEGEVVVSAAVVARDESAVAVRFEVADTGIGVPEDALPHVFDSFIQGDASTTRRYGGTGLGLAICRSLVALMGGEIDVESTVGEGSVFRLVVPMRAMAAPEGDDRLRGRRALVVAGEAAMRSAVAGMLDGWGVEVAVAAGPGEALAALRSAAGVGDPIDVVVCALELAGMDGVDLSAAIGHDPSIRAPIVLLAGCGAATLRSRRHPLVRAVLDVPVRASGLFDALVEALDGASPEPPGPAAAGRPRGDGRRVLVVDDNAVNQRVALIMLEKAGYRADAVADGEQALAALRATRYDAVLMDLEMPVLNGYAATAAIRRGEAGPVGIPIVALTAAAMQADVDRAIAAGVDAFVAKPIRVGDVDRALAAVLDRAGRSGALGAPAPRDGDIDRGHVAQLVAVHGAETVRSLVAELLAGLAEDRRRVEAALAAGDHEAARIAAHGAKGAASTVGASGLAAALRRVEEAARDGDAAGARAALAGVDAAVARMSDAYEAALA